MSKYKSSQEAHEAFQKSVKIFGELVIKTYITPIYTSIINFLYEKLWEKH